MDPNSRGKVIVDKKLCVLCFGGSHSVANCNKKSTWKPCDTAGCGKWHARMLHGATTPGLCLAITSVSVDDNTDGGVLLLVQQIQMPKGNKAVVFWDHGSTTALVTYKFAEDNDLKGEKCKFELTGVGNKTTTFNTQLFSVPLVDNSGTTHQISAFGIERITSSNINKNISQAVKHFEEVQLEDVCIPGGEVDVLIGMNNVSIMPTKVKVSGELALFKSIFGTGKLLGGSTRGGAGVSDEVEQLAQEVAHAEAKFVKMDFLSAEAFGVEVPKRCSTCRGCKECQFKNSQLSYEEMIELTAIEENLVLDVAAAKWTTEYSYKQDPSILQDNFQQAFACMASTERRLKKKGQLHAYDEQFMENVSRGIFKKVSEEELRQYKGPVNYITIVEAFKPGPHSTTPLRLCMNSSLRFHGISLNDILMKGPSALNDILSVTLGFRSHQVAIVKDISKFYQSVNVVERDQHLRRVLHRQGGHDGKPDVYKTTSVNFGDKIAGCISQCALRGTATTYKSMDEVAAIKIQEDTYVDDTISGDKDKKSAIKLSENMDAIAAKGGFIYKETVISGDASSDEPRKVLGLGWDSGTDTIYIGTKVNISAKKKGIKEMPDIELEELVGMMPEEITRRMVWRVVLGQYDILGLISVFTIRLKLIMKKLVGDADSVGEKVMWDKPISKQLREEFLGILEQLLVLKKTRFPRCVVPSGAKAESLPDLLILADGSQSAFCALAYLRSEMADGSYQCRLIAGKTRVAPSKKISVPRMELMAALTAVRLAKTVQEGLRLEIGERWFFTDNSAVLAMIRRPSGSFQEFVGTRVGEIRSKCEAEKEWYWIPTDKNLADMGTRENVVPKDLGPESQYQCGQPWMSQPRADWPTTQTPGQVPQEELVPAAKVHITTTDKVRDFFPLKGYKTVSQAVGNLALVLKYLQNLKDKTRGREVTPELKDKAEIFLLNRAQESVRLAFSSGELDTLRPQKLPCQSLQPVELIVTAGRLEDKMLIGYDKSSLPILKCSDDLATLYMRESHQMDHGGVDRTLQRSRNHVWIVQGRRLAKVIVANCFTCKIRNKQMKDQLMAPVHNSRLPPSPVFDSTAVDLFGPLKIRDSVKKRVSKDCWGVLYVCTVTGAVHLGVTEDYSTDGFLMSMKQFINLRGCPSKMMSDPGSQLVAAAKQTEQWDYQGMHEWLETRRIEWHIIPTNSQHYNGCAESLIKATKRQLTEMMKNRLFTKGELDTLFTDVMQIINSRPLVQRAGSDPTSGGPLTPNHLLLGRASVQVPTMIFDHKASLTKRVAFLEGVKKSFWNKWIQQVFPQLIPSYKWRKPARNMIVGDIVLMKKESELSNSYKMAVVKKADAGVDGKVRKVLLGYKNVDGNPKYKGKGYKEMETERAVHNLVVIVPADYKEEECSENQTVGPGPRSKDMQ